MSNPSRFSGFAGLYDAVRPAPPVELGQVLRAYAGSARPYVVDLGSGSGLSSRWAAQWAGTVVGVEPNDEMRSVAERHRSGRVSYRSGTAEATGLDPGCADVVLAVQAMHWMEPGRTLAEVARVLRPGGVFAAVDADWPPVAGSSRAERAWLSVERRIAIFEGRMAQGHDLRAPLPPEGDEPVSTLDVVPPPGEQSRGSGVRSWDKAGHLGRMSSSGLFSFTRELVSFGDAGGGSSAWPDAAARFVGLLRSQGSYQQLRRAGLSDEELGVDELERAAHEALSDPPVRVPIGFAWRARIGVTP